MTKTDVGNGVRIKALDFLSDQKLLNEWKEYKKYI